MSHLIEEEQEGEREEREPQRVQQDTHYVPMYVPDDQYITDDGVIVYERPASRQHEANQEQENNDANTSRRLCYSLLILIISAILFVFGWLLMDDSHTAGKAFMIAGIVLLFCNSFWLYKALCC